MEETKGDCDEDVILIDNDFSKYKYVPPRPIFGVDICQKGIMTETKPAKVPIRDKEGPFPCRKNLLQHEKSLNAEQPTCTPNIQIEDCSKGVLNDDSDFQSPPRSRLKAESKVTKGKDHALFLCEICKKDITNLDAQERSVHVNGCIDKIPCTKPDTSVPTCTFILECPLCFKNFPTPEARSSHIKKCGKSRGLGVENILKALQLQEKHALERISMGLPLKPEKSQKLPKKLNIKKLVQPKSRTQSDIQLAKALSLSLEEEERKKRGDFTSDAPSNDSMSLFELKPPAQFQRPGKKPTKKKGLTETPLLLLQTDEERSKLLLDRIAAIIAPEPNPEHADHQIELRETSPHQRPQRLWQLSRESREKNFYYVEELQDWVMPSNVEPGSKMADLSQVPGHKILTQHPFEYTSLYNEEDEDDICVDQPTTVTNALSSLVLNPYLSDVDVLVAFGDMLPAHRLILIARCPALKEILYIPEGKEKYILSLEDMSSDVVAQFLRYIYTGSAKFRRKDLLQVSSLARRYNITELKGLSDSKITENDLENNGEKDGVNAVSNENTSSSLQETITSTVYPVYLPNFEDKFSASHEIQTTLESKIEEQSLTSDDDLEIVYNCINSSLCPTPQEKFEVEGRTTSHTCSTYSSTSKSCIETEHFKEQIGHNVIESPKDISCLPLFKTLKNTHSNSEDNEKTILFEKHGDANTIEAIRLENFCESFASSCRKDGISEVLENRFKRRRLDILSPVNEFCPENTNSFCDSSVIMKKQQDQECDSLSPQKVNEITLASSLSQQCEAKSSSLRVVLESSNSGSCSDNGLERQPTSSQTGILEENDLNLSGHNSVNLITECPDSPSMQDCRKSFVKSSEECIENHEEDDFCFVDDSWRCDSDISENDVTLKFGYDAPNMTKVSEKYNQNNSAEIIEDDVFILHSSFDCDKQTEKNFASNRSLNATMNCSINSSPAKVVPPENVSSFLGHISHGDKALHSQNKSTEKDEVFTDQNDSRSSSPVSRADNFPIFPQTTDCTLNHEQNMKAERKSCISFQKIPVATSFVSNAISKESQQSSLSPEVIIFSSDDELFPEPCESKKKSSNSSSSDGKVSNPALETSCESFSHSSSDSPEVLENDYEEVADQIKNLNESLDNAIGEEASWNTSTPQVGKCTKMKEDLSPESSPFIPLSKRLFRREREESFEDFKKTKKREKKIHAEIPHRENCSPETLQKINILPASEPQASRMVNTEPSFHLSDSPMTPLPNYEGMVTPDIKIALKKIGVKALPRRKAIAVLSQVYDAMHPWVEHGSIVKPDSMNVNKEKKRAATRKKQKSPKKPEAKAPNKVKCKNLSKDITSSPMSEDNCDASNECRPNEIPEWSPSQNGGDEEGLEKEDISSMRDLILNDEKLFESILHYKPLNLVEFQQDLKEKGIKVSVQKLMTFLDEQCITFTCPRKEEYRKKQTARSQNFRKRMIAKMSQKLSP